jgi:hypothetical protein
MLRKLALLGVLLGCLIGLSVAPKQVRANESCAECGSQFAGCLERCPSPPELACSKACELQEEACEVNCTH